MKFIVMPALSVSNCFCWSSESSLRWCMMVTSPCGGALVGTSVGAGTSVLAGAEVGGTAVGAGVVAGAQAASSDPAPSAPESLSISRRVKRLDELFCAVIKFSSLEINGLGYPAIPKGLSVNETAGWLPLFDS